MINSDFERENDELFKFLLNKRFFERFKNHKQDEKDPSVLDTVELFISTKCNLKCKYCYLVEKENELYPPELQDETNILKNLDSLLNYFIKENINPPRIDLFAGEIWGSSFSEEIFQKIYDYKRNNKDINLNFLNIPSNFTFIINNKSCQIIENWIEKFKQIGIRFCFSASVDGLIVEEKVRPFKHAGFIRTEENFYNKMFAFCKKYNYGFHPMVSALDIEYWIENFQWWIKKLQEFDISSEHLMLLEVRDNNWTDDKINEYLKFLNYCIEYYKNIYYKGNLKKFISQAFLIPNTYKNISYINYSYVHFSNQMGCSVGTALTIRLGDLAIVPCHRTSYDKFIYGKFVTDTNNTIIDIKSFNTVLATKILTAHLDTYPKCDTCSIKEFCIRGCFGAQFENSNELFYPCNTVCKLFKAKQKFLKYKYLTEYNLLDIAKNLYKDNEKALYHLKTIERLS